MERERCDKKKREKRRCHAFGDADTAHKNIERGLGEFSRHVLLLCLIRAGGKAATSAFDAFVFRGGEIERSITFHINGESRHILRRLFGRR
jgi:hypothetical protein